MRRRRRTAKPQSLSRRSVTAALACLAMLVHLLGMSLMAHASAPARQALGIGGHCQQLAERPAGGAMLADQADHARVLVHYLASASDIPAQHANEPGSNACCCASSCTVAISTDGLAPSLPESSPQPGIAWYTAQWLPSRFLRTAIHPRAPPRRSMLR